MRQQGKIIDQVSPVNLITSCFVILLSFILCILISQMHVLYVMSFVVERVGHPIRPHVSNLIQYLPLAWEESAEHSMLRCAIVSTLVQIVKVSYLFHLGIVAV